jgi:hypothetical protein
LRPTRSDNAPANGVSAFDGDEYTSFGWYKAFRIDVRGDEASMLYRHL